MPKDILANNLRFLRGEHGLSQEVLAEAIGVKRSSIAAYECKGVEPRLPVLIRIAKYFNIDLAELIEKRLTEESSSYSPFIKSGKIADNYFSQNDQDVEIDQETYSDHIRRIDKIVDGFKTYFEYKLQQEAQNESTKRLSNDVKHFISILEHILESNQSFRDNNFSNEA